MLLAIGPNKVVLIPDSVVVCVFNNDAVADSEGGPPSGMRKHVKGPH